MVYILYIPASFYLIFNVKNGPATMYALIITTARFRVILTRYLIINLINQNWPQSYTHSLSILANENRTDNYLQI